MRTWYKSNNNILSRTCNTKRKERLISWEKLEYDHFNSTSRFSILITLKEGPDLRPAMEVWVLVFFSLN